MKEFLRRPMESEVTQRLVLLEVTATPRGWSSDGGVFRAGDPGYVPRRALMVESGIPGGSGS